MHTLLFASLLLAQTTAPAVDLGEAKAKLKGLTDGKGHYILYNGERPYDAPLLTGDGKTLYVSRVIGGGMSGDERWSVTLWDPRVGQTRNGKPSIEMEDSGKKYSVTCGLKVTPLTPVADAEVAALLAKAAVRPPLWTRYPDKLMRDDVGNYFFVDRLRTEEENDRRDFRVFMGPRGKMKPLPLKDIVDDSEGTIYATKDGVLRLITTDKASGQQVFKWVVGKVETKLIDVPVQDNVRMIYMDLGPYSGLPLGTACDPVF
jgi:hypothetical protein